MAMPIGDPFIVLMERTLENLHNFHRLPPNFSQEEETPAHKKSLFEVTQTVNSFLSILVMPWDRVFNKRVLCGETNKNDHLKKHGFPPLENSDPNDVRPNSLGAILEGMRHGAAHGGIRILDLQDFHKLCPCRPSPLIQVEHIAGLEIETKADMGRGNREWGCALSIDELKQFLVAMVYLSRQEKYVLPDVWKKHQKALAELQRANRVISIPRAT